MHKQAQRQPICRQCGLPGLHGTVDKCLSALKAAIAKYPPPKKAEQQVQR